MQDSELKKASSIHQTGRSKIIQIWSMQKQIANNFSSGQINQKCIFLVGDTNVGKTTLLYYLSGLKLNLIEDSNKKTKQMLPQVTYEKAIICNNLSTTQIPNVYSKGQGELGISLIDMPGMNDNRFVCLISNILTFEQVFHKTTAIKQIHIAFVISQEMFDAQDIKENIRQFIEHFNLEILQQQKNISLIFTKTQDDIDFSISKFFQYLESIKEDIDEDEQEKDIARFIEILIQLNQKQLLAYCFPKQQPDQQEGQLITEHIVERNQFIQNDQKSLLNDKMMENILLSSKLKSSTFQSNFIELLNQLEKTFQLSLQMAAELIKFMHKQFASSLFADQDSFESAKNNFLIKFYELILSFRKNPQKQDTIDKDQFTEIISKICQKSMQQQKLYAVDKAFKQTFNCTNSEQLTSSDEHPKFTFLIDLSKCFSQVFLKILKALRNSGVNELLVGSIKNMVDFYDWISSSWFVPLSKVHSLQKITDKILQTTQNVIKLKQKLWNQLNNNLPYFELFTSFSQKPIQEDSSDSDQQSDEQPEIVHKVVGPTLSELHQKYIKPKYQKITSTIKRVKEVKNPKQQEEQKKREADIQTIVKNLEAKILAFVKDVQSNKVQQFPFTDEQISLVFSQHQSLRHRIFLESVLKNFYAYLKFFVSVMNYKKDRRRDWQDIKMFFEFFIENTCEILQQYWLYEEAILIYLLSDNLEKALKTMTKGFEYQLMGLEFIKELLTIIDKLTDQKAQFSKLTSEKHEQLSQIITKSYNYLISQASYNRSQQQQYQTQFIQTITKLQSLPRDRTPSPQTSSNLNLNIKILQVTTLAPNKILKKVQDKQRRNSSSEILSIYRNLFPHRQKAHSMTQTPGLNETILTLTSLTPVASK